jgi:hypothetical protein
MTFNNFLHISRCQIHLVLDMILFNTLLLPRRRIFIKFYSVIFIRCFKNTMPAQIKQ